MRGSVHHDDQRRVGRSEDVMDKSGSVSEEGATRRTADSRVRDDTHWHVTFNNWVGTR